MRGSASHIVNILLFIFGLILAVQGQVKDTQAEQIETVTQQDGAPRQLVSDDEMVILDTQAEQLETLTKQNEVPVLLLSDEDIDILAAADAALAANQNEQNFRSLFNTRNNSDEFSLGANADAAMRGVNQLKALTQVRGSSVNLLGNDGGGQADPLAAESETEGQIGETGTSDADVIFVAKMTKNCIYDEANARPCNSQFREPSGRCTNTVTGRKTWGMALTPFTRKLPARYEDGFNSRRITGHASGKRLPNPRRISSRVTGTDRVLNNAGVSAHIMQWGQFIAHEFTQLSEADATVACCPDQVAGIAFDTPTKSQINDIRDLLQKVRGDVCMPIENSNDPIYKGDVCMTHVRSRPAPQHQCVPDQRQQLNAITHVFDASAVYGSSRAELVRLREGNSRKLKEQKVQGRRLPPQDMDGCDDAQRSVNRCPFLGGDNRINTTPNLISAHAAFVIFHNDIADELKKIEPNWNEDRIFQESRKIVSAVQSNINYYEWLPIVVGSSIITQYHLGEYKGYSQNTNPSTLNELASAAMRFGHTLINGRFTLIRDNGELHDSNSLNELFFDTDIIYRHGVRQAAKGLHTDRPWIFDRNFPRPMRDTLFRQRRDIVALNLNRGRDHGLDSYAEYRRAYGLSVPKSWSDMRKTHPKDVVQQLESVYRHVGDVELYIGAVTEFPIEGAIVGKLFANILADGFARLRNGDRFWFENNQFTPKQLAVIRKYKYAQLLCEAHSVPTIVNQAFFRNDFNGAKEQKCSLFPKLNLNLWKGSGNCGWRIVSETPCCGRRKTIRRVCDGNRRKCCPGFSIIRPKCKSIGYSYNSDFLSCFRGGLIHTILGKLL